MEVFKNYINEIKSIDQISDLEKILSNKKIELQQDQTIQKIQDEVKEKGYSVQVNFYNKVDNILRMPLAYNIILGSYCEDHSDAEIYDLANQQEPWVDLLKFDGNAYRGQILNATKWSETGIRWDRNNWEDPAQMKGHIEVTLYYKEILPKDNHKFSIITNVGCENFIMQNGIIYQGDQTIGSYQKLVKSYVDLFIAPDSIQPIN